MDFITIDNLRIRSVHGCNPRERTEAQDFLVSIRAGCSLERAGTTDALQDTLDFNFFCDTTKRVFGQKSYYLLEALAEDIIRELMLDTRVLEVTLSITKPEVLPDAIPGITLTRGRKG